MSNDQDRDLDIAVIGMAGRFPGAGSVEVFWRNLRAGVESIRDLSEDELRAAGVDEATLADPRFVRRAADLMDAERFDAALFGFTPREAELMDPQIRVFLEDAWRALEDAGIFGDAGERRVGVFAGASPNTYLLHNVYANPAAAEALGAFQTSIGNGRDYLATHVSYRLDLRGPSLTVQTACSTSLVAVHLACQSLLSRECDVALAGGVSITVPQTAGYLYEEGGIASRDGRCRAFDEAAAGCVKGNGSAVVVLKRLADALRDGDDVRVVIRGSAVNNDGGVKVGFTAPGVDGQAGVIAEALAAAGVDAETIGFVETHGTATALGDPVEVAALARAFGLSASRPGRCAIGSVKTNIGHLDAAAGVAGLVKAALTLMHREIPPSLHFQRPNPRLELFATPFYVNATLKEWPAAAGPRRAAVSSFGIGGTNAHVILEEAPTAPRSPRARPAQLLVLSAATDAAREEAARSLAARLESDSSIFLPDAAFTLQVGRRRHAFRRALVARDAAEAIEALRAPARAGEAARDERRGTEVVFLFPGQGAQRSGMAAGLYRDEPVFSEAFDRCAEIFRPLLDLDLRDLVFAEPSRREAADTRLTGTALAQPALFAVEHALARLWMSWGVRPAAMAGHSLGEYVAACLAGVMPLEDAARLVVERGRLMGSMPRGAMLAARLGEKELTERLARHPALALAAVNAPASCVASGPEAAIARLEEELSAEGVVCRRLRTSHAYHSSMMDPIVSEFEQLVGRVPLSPPSIPFVSNVTGTWITSEQAADPAYWARHLRTTVRFADGVATLLAEPSRALLEAGPGAALASLARQQAGPHATIVPSLGRDAGADDETAALTAAGRLWCAGVDLDWRAFHEGHGRRRVPLPTYPFQRGRHWIEPSRTAAPTAGSTQTKNPDLAAWFYLPGWKRSRARIAKQDTEPPWLVLDDGSELARSVAALAASRGARVTRVSAGTAYARTGEDTFALDPRRRDHYDALLRDLETGAPGRIVHFWCADASRVEADAAQDLGFFAMLFLLQALGAAARPAPARLATIARDLFDVAGETVARPERATLVGICRVAPQEYPGVVCRLIDPGACEVEAAARAILDEMDADDREPVVARRGGYRWVPAHQPARVEAPREDPDLLRPGGCYLLTGGAGPLEIAVARRLAASGAKGIAFLDCGEADRAALAPLDELGIAVHCFRARVTDGAALAAALEEARERLSRLDVVFHTAGAIGGGMMQIKGRDAADEVLAPRVHGARALAGRLQEGETLVLFSSAISATGVFGQVDYCGASAFLDAFAQSRRSSRKARVIAIDWGTAHWDRWTALSGAGAEALSRQLKEIQEAVGITVEEGVDALWRALELGEPQVVVSTQDLDALIAQSTTASVADFLEAISPAPAAGAFAGREVAPAQSDTEARVAAVWSSLLGVEPIGRTDNFFDLGGNSLLAIQLASQLRKVFDVDLTIASLFESADLASLATAVDAALRERREAEEVSRLLAEIESLTDDQIREELARSAGHATDGAPR